jgi:hypothetical protein
MAKKLKLFNGYKVREKQSDRILEFCFLMQKYYRITERKGFNVSKSESCMNVQDFRIAAVEQSLFLSRNQFQIKIR